MAWPDHGVPQNPENLLEMIQEVGELQKKFPHQPSLVHCSAGIGRTGTYILISTVLTVLAQMLEAKQSPPPLNLMKSVHQLRGMRAGMVSHVEQYLFCYKTISAFVDKLGKVPSNAAIE